MEILKLFGALIILTGSIFLFLGALGIFRMPDLYNRMQAGTKSTTLGSILTLFGIGVYHTEWMGQMLILIIFIVTTNPISSHALARAAHFVGIPLTKKSITDKLEDEHLPEQENQFEEVEEIL